jgi:hypothetical protein
MWCSCYKGAAELKSALTLTFLMHHMSVSNFGNSSLLIWTSKLAFIYHFTLVYAVHTTLSPLSTTFKFQHSHHYYCFLAALKTFFPCRICTRADSKNSAVAPRSTRCTGTTAVTPPFATIPSLQHILQPQQYRHSLARQPRHCLRHIRCHAFPRRVFPNIVRLQHASTSDRSCHISTTQYLRSPQE